MEKNIIDYITKFIKDNGSAELLKLWKSKDTQKDFKNSLNIKKEKKKKDPSLPKNGKSAYMFFCIEKRKEIVEQNQGLKPPQILAELGREWNLIKGDESKISKYVLLSEQDKQRYKDEMAQREGASAAPEEEEEKVEEEGSLTKLNMKELREQCKAKGLKGYSKLSKEDIIAKLNE